MTDEAPKPLPTVNAGAEAAVETVGEVVKVAEPAVESAIIAAVPWMGTPVWKQIWEAILHRLFLAINSALGFWAGSVVVRIEQYEALKNAASALAELKAAQASGDPDAIKKANASTDAAVAPILHYVGDHRAK